MSMPKIKKMRNKYQPTCFHIIVWYVLINQKTGSKKDRKVILNKKSSKTLMPEVILDKDSAAPLHLQLCEKITELIIRQRPKAGTRLVSERKLADKLEVDRSTVHRAYTQLLKENIFQEIPPSRSLFISNEAQKKLQKPFPNIGIILPCKFSEFINDKKAYRLQYMNGIIDRAGELEYSTMIITLPPLDSTLAYVKEWKKHTMERITGVIHMGDRDRSDDSALKMLIEDSHIIQVFISGFSKHPHIRSVIGDIESGIISVAECLREFGHRNLCFITEEVKPNPKLPYIYESTLRLEIIKQCFKNYHLELPESSIIKGFKNKASLKNKLDCLFKTKNSPTAICCISDETANLTIGIIEELGLKVPNDISVFGFDGISTPRVRKDITSIRLPFYAIGRSAVDTLHDVDKNGLTKDNLLRKHPTSLILKNTIGPLQS